jgi:hypothetical protein
MSLDPAALRANAGDPGLSKQARKAAAKAKADAFRADAWATLKRAAGNLPNLLLVVIALAVVASASAFDWWMSARGWRDLLPGIGLFANAGAAAAVGFWYLGVHNALDKFESTAPNDRVWAIAWGVVAGCAYLICVLGVGIATLTNTAEAQRDARASRVAYAQLLSDRDALKTALDVYGVDYWQRQVVNTERALKAQLAIANGTYGLPDLDVDGACAGKLNFNQVRACAYANGGVDPSNGQQVPGLRSQIEAAQAGLKKALKDADDLAAKNAALATFKIKTGDATAEALGSYFDDTASGEKALLIVFVMLTAMFLFCGGFFSHWVWKKLTGR